MTIIDLIGKEEKNCTGCTACEKTCPLNAIAMQFNAEGFLYPAIDSEKCIDCGKCARVCHAVKKYDSQNNLTIYSYSAADEVRMESSSGGAFYLLAESVIKKGGVVFGAAYDSGSGYVRHFSSDEKSLQEIMRSKYVQSILDNTYLLIKKGLDAKREVLFCGTPCQVAGLLSYLGEKPDNLLTVDFVCHGVPSPKFFNDYVKQNERKTGKKNNNVTFREKRFGWRDQHICYYADDGSVSTVRSKDDIYYRSFLGNLILRKACFNCRYPIHHLSDITLMDLWSIRGDDDKGVSGIMANTPQGQIVLKQLGLTENKADISKLSACFTPHDTINEYKSRERRRDIFFRIYESKGIDRAIEFSEKTLNSLDLKKKVIFWAVKAPLIAVKKLVRMVRRKST